MRSEKHRAVPLRGTLRHKPGALGGEAFLNNAEQPGAGPNVSRDTGAEWSRMFPEDDKPMGALKGLAWALLLVALALIGWIFAIMLSPEITPPFGWGR